MTIFREIMFWYVDPTSEVEGVRKDKYALPCCLIIPFNLTLNMTMFWQYWILIFQPHESGAKEQLICYYVASCLVMQHDHIAYSDYLFHALLFDV